jgi:hypothetical protein
MSAVVRESLIEAAIVPLMLDQHRHQLADFAMRHALAKVLAASDDLILVSGTWIPLQLDVQVAVAGRRGPAVRLASKNGDSVRRESPPLEAVALPIEARSG